jgi:hypothetical protein
MEVDGLKRVLFKIVLPALVITAWLCTVYWPCKKADGFDVFLFWILGGLPFGIKKMGAVLPIGGSLMYSLGILSIDLILGGLVGGIIVIIKAVMIMAEVIRMIAEMITGKASETVTGM